MSKLTTEYIQLDDIKMAYTEFGSGKILLLLHGNTQSKKIFKRYQTKYFPMFHTIALDSRGHGQSRSTDDAYTFDQYSDDIINFCNAEGIIEAYVIGYSDGGNTCLLLAKKAPHLFTRLIAISPNYLVSGIASYETFFVRLFYRILLFLNRIGFNLHHLSKQIDLTLNDTGITEAELETIHTRIKILYAQWDSVKEEHLKTMARLIPNVTLDMVPGTNHWSIFNSRKAIEIMKDFLFET